MQFLKDGVQTVVMYDVASICTVRSLVASWLYRVFINSKINILFLCLLWL